MCDYLNILDPRLPYDRTEIAITVSKWSKTSKNAKNSVDINILRSIFKKLLRCFKFAWMWRMRFPRFMCLQSPVPPTHQSIRVAGCQGRSQCNFLLAATSLSVFVGKLVFYNESLLFRVNVSTSKLANIMQYLASVP